MDRSAAASRQSQSQSQMPTCIDSDFKHTLQADAQSLHSTIFKVPKRKRLVKACDACHKSKRRCDGTAPCSNCYYASKECTYTDSSGRRVPAPNISRPDIIIGQPNPIAHSPTGISVSAPGMASGSYPSPETFHSPSGVQEPDASLAFETGVSGPSYFTSVHSIDTAGHHLPAGTSQSRNNYPVDTPRDRLPPRKRHKNEPEPSNAFSPYTRGPPMSGDSLSLGSGLGLTNVDGTSYRRADGAITPGGFDKLVVHELVNLFFAHCHPHRLIIHAPSFNAALCRGNVPSYLLNAVCAVAAPLSQNPLIRESPIRESGQKFADAATVVLFDEENRLQATGVEVAQALVLLQTYKVYKESNMEGDLGLYNHALQILHSLQILGTKDNDAESTSFTPDELYARSIQRETARRTFWLVHLIELLGAIFNRRPTMYNNDDLSGVRLPSDEASFDLALEVPSDRVEYLDSPALKTSDTSEFGHLIRIATILVAIERNNLNSPDPHAILDCEQQLEHWVTSLSGHLSYSPDNLQMQLSLWETISNTGTWCFCFMHILHACAVLALSNIRKRLGQGPCRDMESALTAVPAIINALGPRARNSILMGSVLWLQYCGPHAPNNNDPDSKSANSSPELEGGSSTSSVANSFPQLQAWIKEWEEFWGPGTMHGNDINQEATSGKHLQANQKVSASAPVSSYNMSTNEAQATSDTAVSWNVVPNVVIDPVLRSEEEDGNDSTSAPHASPALSSTSTLRGGRDQPLLPSLKSSGLLDVVTDDSFGGRSSGASTPVKQPPSWSLSTSNSPRPSLLSPGPHILRGSSPSGSAPVSPQPHSPNFPSSHMPQLRLQAPGFYQPNVAQPSSGIVASLSPNPETDAHVSRHTFGSLHDQVQPHVQQQSYFEQNSSPVSP